MNPLETIEGEIRRLEAERRRGFSACLGPCCMTSQGFRKHGPLATETRGEVSTKVFQHPLQDFATPGFAFSLVLAT